MNRTSLALRLIVLLFSSCCIAGAGDSPLRERVYAAERQRVITAAGQLVDVAPVTVTASRSPRSAGGEHDYFSEGEEAIRNMPIRQPVIWIEK